MATRDVETLGNLLKAYQSALSSGTQRDISVTYRYIVQLWASVSGDVQNCLPGRSCLSEGKAQGRQHPSQGHKSEYLPTQKAIIILLHWTKTKLVHSTRRNLFELHTKINVAVSWAKGLLWWRGCRQGERRVVTLAWEMWELSRTFCAFKVHFWPC